MVTPAEELHAKQGCGHSLERRRNLYPKLQAVGRVQKGRTALLSMSGAHVGKKRSHGGVRGKRANHRSGSKKGHHVDKEKSGKRKFLTTHEYPSPALQKAN